MAGRRPPNVSTGRQLADSAGVTVAPGPAIVAPSRRVRRLREARGQATVLAVILWLAAAWLLSAPGLADRFGKVKGTDFAYFYTFGAVARDRQPQALYDHARLHEIQASLIPASSRDYFYSVYPPQVALIFAPLSVFPYLWALALWSLATVLGYAFVVRAAWRAHRSVLPSGLAIATFAASFPPLWYLVLHGQTTLIVLLSFGLAGMALHGSRPFAGGLALGLLACKPQWAPVVAVVLLLRGEWRMLAGMTLSVAAQGAAVACLLGVEPLLTYVGLLPAVAGLPIAPKPYLMHSVGAWTNLLPRPASQVVWAAAVAVIVAVAVRSWRRDAPAHARLGTLVSAAVLASPHLSIYDATAMALPLMWWAGLAEREPGIWPGFYSLVFALWIAFLVPTALLIRLQLSVPILAILFWQSRRLCAPRG